MNVNPSFIVDDKQANVEDDKFLETVEKTVNIQESEEKSSPSVVQRKGLPPQRGPYDQRDLLNQLTLSKKSTKTKVLGGSDGQSRGRPHAHVDEEDDQIWDRPVGSTNAVKEIDCPQDGKVSKIFNYYFGAQIDTNENGMKRSH